MRRAGIELQQVFALVALDAGQTAMQMQLHRIAVEMVLDSSVAGTSSSIAPSSCANQTMCPLRSWRVTVASA